ncbi:hypothetical protein F4778DRAFT_751205 [Xylariomycetidae sp. FL2044]|nr:hypothetical protein F4778DRAFT_751205 [Xylariomycetidae sp. FL2044]
MTRTNSLVQALAVSAMPLVALFVNAVDVLTGCAAVQAEMPDRVSIPGTTEYNLSISSYYSGQEKDLEPGCIFTPSGATEVSRFITSLTKNGFEYVPQFAIRSGGHMIWKGAANIERGITVDMRAINSVTLTEDKKGAILGAGGIWSDIYTELVPHNLTVMGGRVAGIGVGGLSTGGGINYLSRRYGWVCDNIYAYEVVLADGQVIRVTSDSYDDMWLALKGGSNNFGIVTSIEVPTWPMAQMYRGALSFSYTSAVLEAQANAFSRYMDPVNFDDASDMGLALVFQDGSYAVGNSLFYVEPDERPAVYEPFLAVPGLISSMTGLENVANITKEAVGVLPESTPR